MPYPIDNPTAKHDFLQASDFSSCTSVIDTFGFSDTESLLHTLEHESLPTNVVRIGSIYSYRDSPTPPLSRSLCIIGVIDASQSELGKLISNDFTVPTFLHRCTIAVKRADGDHANRLKQEERKNANEFAALLRKLKKEGAMAILAKDKYSRFGIIVTTDDISLDGPLEAQNFAALCYVGSMKVVRENLISETSRHKRPLAAVSNHDDDGVWKPPDNVDNDYWQPPNTSLDTSFQFTTNETTTWQPNGINTSTNQYNHESTFHADAGAAAADRFYSGLTRTLDTRSESRLYHMRAFNGWVKATQVQELDPKTSSKKPNSPLRVLDLACGKGGDLGKWVLHPRGIQNYVGIDVARGSLVDAAIRARKMSQKLKRCTFTCADLGADVPGRLKTPKHRHMQKLSTWSLDRDRDNNSGDPEFKLLRGGGITKEDKFDVVSIQFAIHYMMETKKRALRFFQTVSELLDIGGNLIVTTIDARVIVNHLMDMGLNLHFDTDESNDIEPIVITVGAGACRIKFEPKVVQQIFTTKWSIEDDVPPNLFGLQYSFTLVEGSDHASGIGDAVDLPEWLIPIPVLRTLGRQAGLEIEYAQNFHEFFELRSDPSAHAAAHTSLYNMKVLNRNGSISADEFEISGLYVALKFRKIGESKIQIDDFVDEEEASDNEDDVADIDPKLKSKYYHVALLNAKRSFGSDAWSVLSNEEKTKRTERELLKLIAKS
jgi:mRNA (guanine-N7-)-methyltransferase